MGRTAIPRLFRVAGTRRGLCALAALTLLSGAAMLPALRTMAGHGASVLAFEKAGSVARSEAILAEWGAPGKSAMWWQLALDTPFLIGYGLFLAGACAAAARRAGYAGRARLAATGALLVWLGPTAAAADLLQNVSLAFVLSGRVEQPWPRISALAGSVTTSLALIAAAFAIGASAFVRFAPRTVD
ncbi:MAG TPA: hypothetical protein VFN89_08010 [Solirubrobacterales bacterium]|nr:hypothetical protein [Solirubrobacterales bacterium]